MSDGQLDSLAASTVHLSVDQAAEHAGLSAKTIRRMIARGQLATGRVGQAHVIELAELDRALQARQVSRDSPAVPRPGLARGQVQDVVQQLLDRLERQAGELAQLRDERDRLTEQLLALAAPPQRPWWRRLLEAS